MAAVWEIGIPWRAVEGMEFVYGSTYSQDGHSLPSMFHFPLDLVRQLVFGHIDGVGRFVEGPLPCHLQHSPRQADADIRLLILAQ